MSSISQSLPLVLAGPILRRTEATAVTVWLVLSQPRRVTLKIFETNQQGHQLGAVVWTATGQTVQLGHSLHVLALTASGSASNNEENRLLSQQQKDQLEPGNIYAYNLFFEVGSEAGSEASSEPSSEARSQQLNLEPCTLPEALCSQTWPDISVSYFEHQCPTFALSPAQLDQLQLFHGSCRKVHDRGYDALPILDLAIAHHASEPNQRPHQLFLTGDQIYGDEVADPLLWAIQKNCERLFGWCEPLQTQSGEALSEQDRKPGQRTQAAECEAGLTASFKNTPEKAASHLFSFQEYCITYLLSWSQCGWDLVFPTAAEQGLAGEVAERWKREVKHLKKLLRSQPHVRRALANVPTYMIFDDHEISDDWNLNRLWCERVYGKALGRQVVRNGLLAYSLFQAWGNTPRQFAPNQLGEQLIDQARVWLRSQGKDQTAAKAIEHLLGLPQLDSQGNVQFVQDGSHQRLSHSAHVVRWHYRIEGTCHEVVVLDTRTQRGYPTDAAPEAIPQLLSPAAFAQQLQPMLDAGATEQPESSRLTFVVAPTNVFSLKLLTQVQHVGRRLGREFDMDVGDSWNLEEQARSELLSRLFAMRDRIIVLTGDIHFSASIHLDYQEKPQAVSKTMVQLTASAFCNSDSVTGFLHTKLKSFFPEPERYFQQGQTRYRTRWVQRQPATCPEWEAIAPWVVSESGRAQCHDTYPKLARVWYGRWLQEGREVVGFNNLGQVMLEQQHRGWAVAHHVHWYAPWQPGQLVTSRFWTRLD